MIYINDLYKPLRIVFMQEMGKNMLGTEGKYK